MEQPRRFVYGVKPIGCLIPAALFFFCICAWMGRWAASLPRLSLFFGVPLSASGSVVLNRILAGLLCGGAGLSAMCALFALALAGRRIVCPRILELGEHAIVKPHGFLFFKTRRISYADVKRVRETGRTLFVATEFAEFEILPMLLPDMDSYLAIRDFLFARFPATAPDAANTDQIKPDLPCTCSKEEFLSRQAAAERKIRRRVIPFPIVWSAEIGLLMGIVVLAPLLFLVAFLSDYAPNDLADIRGRLIWGLASCISLYCLCLLANHAGRRRFVELALKCPKCDRCLVFDGEIAATGRCPRCGQRLFDT
jgi:hypothetical protein